MTTPDDYLEAGEMAIVGGAAEVVELGEEGARDLGLIRDDIPRGNTSDGKVGKAVESGAPPSENKPRESFEVMANSISCGPPVVDLRGMNQAETAAILGSTRDMDAKPTSPE